MSIRSPVNGWSNASRVACRNCRVERGSVDAVDRVADDRQVDRREVHADLVHAAGLELDAQQRVVGPEPLDLEVRDRLARRVRVERDAGRVVAVAADRRLDTPGPRARPAAHEREVRALEPALADELREPLVRLVGARDDHQPGRVAVEPVDDARLRPGSPPPTTPASASTSVPLACPAPAWTTSPAGLSTTARCSST